jgi:hypothetical protein
MNPKIRIVMKNSFLAFFLLLSLALGAQEASQTLELPMDGTSPQANLSDVDWIQGHWKGEALGGQVEEIWSPPLGESMMGSFKLVQNGKVKFYEIMTISETEKTLILRIKHFDAQLKGWEEKDETVDFKLVKVTPDKIYFDGLTFERITKNEINVFVRFDNDGSHSEGKFNYHRVKP